MGFWKTVGAGLAVVALSKVFELFAEHLPTKAAGAATWLWSVISYSASVPVILALPIVAAIYKLLDTNMELQKAAEENERAQFKKDAAEREKAIKLSTEELAVVEALIYANPPVDYGDLERETGLTRLRLSHAIAQLRTRGFLTDGQNEYFWLSTDGQKYVVDNELDVIVER